jgi:competence protein ComGC
MENSDPTIIIILAEITLILFVILASILITLIIKKRKKAVRLAKAVNQIKENRQERQQSLVDSISTTYTINKDALTPRVDEICKEEEAFIKSILLAHIQADINAFENLDNDFNKFSEQYIKLLELKDQTESSKSEEKDDEPVIPDVDEAVDDLLSTEENSGEVGSEFDLSDADDLDADNFPDISGDDIAEIPDNLLNTD